ncbi:MAG TPA: DUF1365 domain-containing protein [Steroidobacteraceae bacterium]|jgi:hypothetical protein
MALNSCVYECQVMHQRLAPSRYALRHALFMFYLDLDELELLSQRLRLFSHRGWNLYSFRDDDHMPGCGGVGRPLRHRLEQYLSEQGIRLSSDSRICLLTLPRVLGYVFNPISVYFCFQRASDTPLCAVAEVGNTFGEQKLYLLPAPDAADQELFTLRIPKHYYVSPFSSLTLQFDFRLRVPAQALDIRVDDYDGDRRVLRSGLRGQRCALSDSRLLWFALKYPLLTLKVIGLIHWHALRLWRRGLPWYRKRDNPQLQLQVLKPKGLAKP